MVKLEKLPAQKTAQLTKMASDRPTLREGESMPGEMAYLAIYKLIVMGIDEGAGVLIAGGRL